MDLRERSHDTLLSCSYRGDDGFKVVDIQSIITVAAMVPHTAEPDRYFVSEMLGLEVAFMDGNEEEMTDE